MKFCVYFYFKKLFKHWFYFVIHPFSQSMNDYERKNDNFVNTIQGVPYHIRLLTGSYFLEDDINTSYLQIKL